MQSTAAVADDAMLLRLYASQETHSSIDKAAITLGIGQQGVRKIATDAAFRMDAGALRAAVEGDLAQVEKKLSNPSFVERAPADVVQKDRERVEELHGRRRKLREHLQRIALTDEDVEIGDGTTIWHFSHVLRNCRLGNDCRIGQNVVIGPNVRIGNGVKIQNNVSVYEGVTLEDEVFCGPSMVFTNVFNPRSEIRRMDELRPTLVRRGATLGANCTIVCGATIGQYAFVGAGAVVTRDVPDFALVVGNPARIIGWMCACGNRIEVKGNKRDGICRSCHRRYLKIGKEEVRAA